MTIDTWIRDNNCNSHIKLNRLETNCEICVQNKLIFSQFGELTLGNRRHRKISRTLWESKEFRISQRIWGSNCCRLAERFTHPVRNKEKYESSFFLHLFPSLSPKDRFIHFYQVFKGLP